MTTISAQRVMPLINSRDLHLGITTFFRQSDTQTVYTVCRACAGLADIRMITEMEAARVKAAKWSNKQEVRKYLKCKVMCIYRSLYISAKCLDIPSKFKRIYHSGQHFIYSVACDQCIPM